MLSDNFHVRTHVEMDTVREAHWVTLMWLLRLWAMGLWWCQALHIIPGVEGTDTPL